MHHAFSFSTLEVAGANNCELTRKPQRRNSKLYREKYPTGQLVYIIPAILSSLHSILSMSLQAASSLKIQICSLRARADKKTTVTSSRHSFLPIDFLPIIMIILIIVQKLDSHFIFAASTGTAICDVHGRISLVHSA